MLTGQLALLTAAVFAGAAFYLTWTPALENLL